MSKAKKLMVGEKLLWRNWLAEELQKEFVGAKGFSAQNLWNMRMYFIAYQAHPKLQTLSRETSWSHNELFADEIHSTSKIKN